MERSTFDNVAWGTALTPHFARQPAWTRVPTRPLCPTSHLSTIMTRVSTLTQRHQTNAIASSILAHQLPSWPGAEDFFKAFAQNPREEQDAPHKKARDDTFLSSDDIHQVNGQPDSKAQAVHDECQALVDVANFYLHRAEERLFPLYRSLRDGTYQAPVIGKRRRGMDHSDLQIQKNTFTTICDVMAPVLMAQRDGRDEITVTSAAIAFQAYETFPQNSRYPLVFNGVPSLSNISERSEEPTPPKAPAQKRTTISLDMKSDSDIFATAPIAQSPTVLATQPRESAAQSPTTPIVEGIPQSPTNTSSSDAASDVPPAAISQLAEAAGHRLDGNANVVIQEGPNGRMFVRFKISADYVSLFPRGKALDESSMVVGTPLCASTPKVLPETVVEPVTPTPKVIPEAIIPEAIIPEPSTPTPAAMPEVVAPITVITTATTDSTLTELTSTPIIYEDEESPSREYMRGFIQRSKRAAENNVSPTRPALAPRSPNQGSPEKSVSPEKMTTPKKQGSPKKVSTPTRRSSRLTNKAPKSSIPTPIRIDSRSGAGRAKAVAPDVAQTTRANTRKNKGRAQYPAEVLAAMGEGGEEKGSSSPVALPKGGKTVHWKSPVEESAPRRVTRSRAKKIAAARA